MPSTRSSRPTWCLLLFPHCPVRKAGDCCTCCSGGNHPECTALLLVDVAPPDIVDNYSEMVRNAGATTLGLSFAMLSCGCVSEQLRWRAKRDHAALGAAGSMSNYVAGQTVSAMGVANEELWIVNLHRPAIFCLTRLKSAPTAVGGTARPAVDRERSRGSRKHPRKLQDSSGSVLSRKRRTIL